MYKIEMLIEKAYTARLNAYAPYSKFKVGAAILVENQKIYGGFNIECSSYSPSNCAERTALFRALYDNNSKFEAIAVVGGKENDKFPLPEYCPPCGVCRQMIREFCNPKTFKFILARDINDYKTFTLEEMLPYSFGPQFLE